MNKKKGKKWIAAVLSCGLIWMSAARDLETASTPFGTAVMESAASAVEASIYSHFLPIAAFVYEGNYESWLVMKQVDGILPLYGMFRSKSASERSGEVAGGNQANREEDGRSVVLEYDEVLGRDEVWGHDEILEYDENSGLGGVENGERIGREEGDESDLPISELQMLLREENEAAMAAMSSFVPHERRMQVDLEELKDYETLVGTFYTIDANTMAGSDQLNVEAFLGRDMSIKGSGDLPQILIYHTHSQEAFADSVPGDAGTTIMGVGEHLAELLRTEYGYNVLHHTGQYDVETRDDAYGKALPELERILAEHPTIEVVIDLHRDQMPEDKRLVMNLDGRPTARFMFFNGLSRTKKTGDIAYLRNENIAGNLAFSFQMQLKAEEYYPGITRKIYLKGYRYNMHLRSRSLLVELGAQNNTVEEAMNACEPLAHLLDMVLAGE